MQVYTYFAVLSCCYCFEVSCLCLLLLVFHSYGLYYSCKLYCEIACDYFFYYILRRCAITNFFLFKLLGSVHSLVKLLGCGRKFLADIIMVEKDTWISGEDAIFNMWKQNGHMFKMPKMILLATNISNTEFDKAKAMGFSDTVIMKPLRASMVAACLQQVLGMGKKRQLGKDMPNGSAFLHSLLYGKKILVVDDNGVNRRVAAGALKKFGADVKCAESGKAALEMLQLPHSFDACFMDIQMPEMDGYAYLLHMLQLSILKYLGNAWLLLSRKLLSSVSCLFHP